MYVHTYIHTRANIHTYIQIWIDRIKRREKVWLRVCIYRDGTYNALCVCGGSVCVRCVVYTYIHTYIFAHTLHINTYIHTLQHTATHCNTPQHTATHCNTLQHRPGETRCASAKRGSISDMGSQCPFFIVSHACPA